MSFQLKKFNRFIASTTTAVIAATAIAPAASAATFKDVPDTSLYKEATDFLFTKDVKGLSDGTFGVKKNITRADAAVMLANVLELDINSAPSAGFTDVNKRVEKHVNALYEAEITKGAGNNKFNPDANITRGELAIWLQKAFKLKAKEIKVPFTDANGIYKDAVAALVEYKVTHGKTATLFGTSAPATRGEYALFLHRAFLIDDQTPLETAIAETEKTIASIPPISEFTLEHWKLVDEVYVKLEKVAELGGSEEDIKNIDVYYDFLSIIFEEDELLPEDFTDATVNLNSGEVTLTFSDAGFFEEYSFVAYATNPSANGKVAEKLMGKNSVELVITFDPKVLTGKSVIKVEVSFMEEHYATYAVAAENGIWKVQLLPEL